MIDFIRDYADYLGYALVYGLNVLYVLLSLYLLLFRRDGFWKMDLVDFASGLLWYYTFYIMSRSDLVSPSDQLSFVIVSTAMYSGTIYAFIQGYSGIVFFRNGGGLRKHVGLYYIIIAALLMICSNMSELISVTAFS